MLRDRLLHRFGDAADALRLAAERRADAFVREVIDRAAAVQIDEIGAARFDERRGPANLFRIGARQLHAEKRLALELANQRELALAPLLQPPRHRHLADRHARAQLDAQTAIGKIRAFGHRRHHDGAGQDLAKIHRLRLAWSPCVIAFLRRSFCWFSFRRRPSDRRQAVNSCGRSRVPADRRPICSDRCTC